MSKFIGLRLPDSLVEKLGTRCSIRGQSKTDVLIEAIERGWEESSVLRPEPQRKTASNPLSIPGVFLGSQLGESEPPVSEVPICSKTWWEDGERYECLMDRGHKNPKHGQGGMARNISE